MTTGGAGGVELAVDVRCGLGESPVWDWRTGELVWVDIRGGDFYRWSGPSCPGGPGAWRSTRVGHCVSAVAPRAAGGFVLATRSGFATLDEAGTFEMMAEVESDMAENRMNDAKCDHRGRLFAGTMSEKYEPGAGSLYVLDVGGAVSKVLGGATTPNGLDWSPDGKTMYFIDSRAYGLDAFDFAEGTGRLTARRRLVDVERHLGLADGMAVDQDGFIWVALHSGGALHRYSAQGRLDMRVELPVSVVTSCTFGGPELTDLYITTGVRKDRDEPLAGAIFHYRAGVPGLPCRLYGG